MTYCVIACALDQRLYQFDRYYSLSWEMISGEVRTNSSVGVFLISIVSSVGISVGYLLG